MRIRIPRLKDREMDLAKRLDNLVAYIYTLARELEVAFQNIDEKNMNSDFLKKEKEDNRLPIGTIILRKEGEGNGGMPYGTWSEIKKATIEGEQYLLYRRNQ